jgi:imidazolonepropionase-like amidohydrolase
MRSARLRAREQLRQGASQIKLMAGGGVTSPHNPIESTQFTEPEIRAAVEAADSWGTYVTVHAYTPRAIRQAVAAGVKCIEHGQLIDEPTAKLLAEKNNWWSLQPLLDDEDVPALSAESQKKAAVVSRERITPTSWRRSTRPRRLLAPMFCSLRELPAGRGQYSPRWSTGTRQPKHSKWPLQTMAN